MKKQLPNILTILRILLTPVFIVLLFYEHPYSNFWALVIFLAIVTVYVIIIWGGCKLIFGNYCPLPGLVEGFDYLMKWMELVHN